MKTHKDLDVWILAIEIAGDVYRITRNFPRNEMYGITSQVKKGSHLNSS